MELCYSIRLLFSSSSAPPLFFRLKLLGGTRKNALGPLLLDQIPISGFSMLVGDREAGKLIQHWRGGQWRGPTMIWQTVNACTGRRREAPLVYRFGLTCRPKSPKWIFRREQHTFSGVCADEGPPAAGASQSSVQRRRLWGRIKAPIPGSG